MCGRLDHDEWRDHPGAFGTIAIVIGEAIGSKPKSRLMPNP